MYKRVADSLGEIESRHEDYSDAEKFKNEILEDMMDKKIIPSTTVLMNAGRMNEAPLSACAVPPVDLRQDLSKVKGIVDQYHFNGMGTGFNFDDIENPIEIIQYLNKIGVEGQRNEKQLKPVGNMGVLSVDHPNLFEVISIKIKLHTDLVGGIGV